MVTVGFPEVTSSLGLRWNSLRCYVSSHSFFDQVHRLFEAKVRRRLRTDRALSDLRLYSLAYVMLFLAICIVIKLVVLVSLDWLCINDVIYDLRRLMYLNLDLCCISVLYD